MDQKHLQVLNRIDDLENEHCKGCKIKEELRKQNGQPLQYCIFSCKIGKKIKQLGGVLEYGIVQNVHAKALDLTKDKYIDLRNDGFNDRQIREKYGISRATMFRRKEAWELTGKTGLYSHRYTPLKKLTKEKLQDMCMFMTEQEIADKLGVSLATIRKYRYRWGIELVFGKAKDKYSKTEYLYLRDKKGLNRAQICELWEVSDSTLYTLLKDWGLIKERRYANKEGLTKERLTELAKVHTDIEIAAMFNFTKNTVWKYRKKWGIPALKREIPAKALKKMLAKGMKRKDIAEHYGVNVSTIYKKIIKYRQQNLL